MKFWILIILLIVNSFVITASLSAEAIENLNVTFNLTSSNDSLEPELTEHSKKISTYLIDNVDNDVDYLKHETELSFKKFLYSFGYFSAIVECKFVNNNQITCTIDTGNYYKLKDIEFTVIPHIEGTNPVVQLPPLDTIELTIGNQIIAKEILNAQEEIKKFIEETNCLSYLKMSHHLLIDKPNNTGIINYHATAGEEAYINLVNFSGLKMVKESYAQHLSGLQAPSCFKKSKITAAKEALQNSGLFSSVSYIIPDKPAKDGALDVSFDVIEQKPRTAKAGIKYTTDIGMGLNANLIHRNLFGSGQKLSSTLTISKPVQLLDTYYENRYFLEKDQKLILQNIIKRELQDAYKNKEASILTSLEKTILPSITIGGGVKYGINKVVDDHITKNYAFVSLPLFVVYDLRDDIIDPKKGFLSKFELIPYINSINKQNKFLKYRISGSCYIPIDQLSNTIIALRANIGRIGKIKTSDIPVNERFFAGGGGSIRGYRYQTAGPLNSRRRPIGGSSIIELTSEVRFKVNDDVGFATFVDAGNVFDSKRPKINSKLFFGAGFGIRYYTSFGPIRADIAFPLHKRRRKVDSILQLYFSIGQAF